MMKTTSFALATLAMAAATSANAQSSMGSSTLPEITVYPNPVELMIDRLSRQIIADIDANARLPDLSQQEANAADAEDSIGAPAHFTRGA